MKFIKSPLDCVCKSLTLYYIPKTHSCFKYHSNSLHTTQNTFISPPKIKPHKCIRLENITQTSIKSQFTIYNLHYRITFSITPQKIFFFFFHNFVRNKNISLYVYVIYLFLSFCSCICSITCLKSTFGVFLTFFRPNAFPIPIPIPKWSLHQITFGV